MKLGEFLANVPPATGSAKKERVEFTVIGMNSRAERVETRAYACFALVTDKEQEEADLAALKSMKDLQQDLGIIPSAVLSNRERAHFLAAALRDFDDPRERLTDAEALQKHVSRDDLDQLQQDYAAWKQRHYPSGITKEQKDNLKQEAQGK